MPLRYLSIASTLSMAMALGHAAVASEQDSGTASTAPDDRLRVCASTQEPPYSSRSDGGFEIEIAKILADATGRTLETVWIERPAIYLVHNGIDEGICDILIGVDTGDPRLLTSRPYYRTGYAFVSRDDRGFEGTQWQHADSPGFSRFAYRFHSPAETILKYAGKYENNLAYSRSLIDFKSRRNQYINVPPRRVVDEVRDGHADVAIAFAPTVARNVRDSKESMRLRLIENDIERSDGVIIPLSYDQSVGVVKSAPELLTEINEALEARAEEIRAVLEAEGIPLLEPEASKTEVDRET